MLKCSKLFVLLVIPLFFISAKSPVRIKDITVIQGMRTNQLMGFGLVTGLNGKGDSRAFALTQTMLQRLAENHGFTISTNDINSKNIAAVLVTAEVKPFARKGEQIDITISSIGDAKSLDSGILLQTPMRGANGTIYAVAQGRIISGTKETDSQNTASIPGGAIIERDISTSYIENDRINLLLKFPDFTTATQIVQAVAGVTDEEMITALDPGLIEIRLNDDQKKNPVDFISQLENLTIVPDTRAIVVIDKKTGVIVAGTDVVIQECSVSTPVAQVDIADSKGDTNYTVSSKTVGELVLLLNKMGISTTDVIGILEAIHAAGAINARLYIL